MNTQRLFLICLPIALLFSCTVEKRMYRPGYHVEWRKSAGSSREAAMPEKCPIRQEADLNETQPMPATSDTAMVLPDGVVFSPETVVIPEVRTDRTPLLRLPEKLQKQEASTVIAKDKMISPAEKQLKQSQQKAGLLLAPLRILFTILLIALVIVGVVMLFVLESALGGTVLLAAGAVLLILIIL